VTITEPDLDQYPSNRIGRSNSIFVRPNGCHLDRGGRAQEIKLGRQEHAGAAVRGAPALDDRCETCHAVCFALASPWITASARLKLRLARRYLFGCLF
jgi:hypothetical protein